MNDNEKQGDLEGFDEATDDLLYTSLDDDRRIELDQMLGLKVVGLELWEDSLGDEEDEPPATPEARTFFDCDLFLEDGQALELYVAAAYPDPDGEPTTGMDAISEFVGRLPDDELELMDFEQADDEGGLALAFGKGKQVRMVLVASAWMVSEWEPEEGASGEEADDEV